MKKVFLLLLVTLAFRASAFHIVGGELEFIALEDGRYVINIVQYFDQAQEQNPGPEGVAEVYIYSNWDDALISRHILTLVDEEIVPYTNQECSIDELETSRVLWSDTLELFPLDYSDPEGYYITWERCCRNTDVVNIRNPGSTGMKYALDIPPLWRNGERFVNSSPILFKPLSDYACLGQLYYVEFTGVDPDGDSLVYSLANPLNTSAQNALPIPQPKPYLEKQYAPGFEAIIPGNPSLRISKEGLLTVNPSRTGLHVFSVRVEEYRNGEKIGEVRRDFQMLVVGGCLPPDPPELALSIPNRPQFEPSSDTLIYSLEEDKCFEFFVTNITNGETINLRAEGVNFNNNINDIFQFTTSFIDPGQDTLQLDVCMPGCPPLGEDPFIVDLIVGDDACPLPQLDTLRLTVVVEPPPNELPIPSAQRPSVTVIENNDFENRIIATDPDGDFMDISVEVEGDYTAEELGLTLDVDSSFAGVIFATLKWNTDCEISNFTTDTSFKVNVKVDDRDECENPVEALPLDYSVILPPNTLPEISIVNQTSTSFDVDQNSVVEFDLQVTDKDLDDVRIFLANGRRLEQRLGVVFEEKTGENGFVESSFSWFVNCELLEEGKVNIFDFFFIADDLDRCQVKNYDTLKVELNVFVPFNNQPTVDDYPDYTLEVNEQFTLDINAFDQDTEIIYLELSPLFQAPESPSLSFEPTSGVSSVSQELRWTPECSLLRNGEPTVYDLIFVSRDERCPVAKRDTSRVSFLIIDTKNNFDDFEPPNAFSPNDDGFNDIFTLTGFDEIANNLPTDNCGNSFQYVSIHDRTGKKVFFSESRDFSWDGGNLPSGVYYYLVKYSQTEYRNYLQLLR